MNKPEDIPLDVWGRVGEMLFTVNNTHHAWGTLAELTPDWSEDLQARICTAILAATAAEREACALVVTTLIDVINDEIAGELGRPVHRMALSTQRHALETAVAAIRNHGAQP